MKLDLEDAAVENLISRTMVAFNVTREEAIKLLEKSYQVK